MSTPTPEANSYDELPYLDHIFPETSPDRMGAIATLYGMTPRDPRASRILELGCANGANLFPLALAFPDSEFVGIDLSARQIENGQAILSLLGLKNVSLRTMSVLDVGEDFGKFDYILCHGVYSWVPEPVRDKILSIFARHLEPDGVAYLSYNTYPGWHFRGMIREMLKYHSDACGDPASRVKEARAMLEFLVKSVQNPDGAYAHVLKDEQVMLEDVQDTYIFHEHLEEVNFPVYFTEIVAAAAVHGLGYLGAAKFDTVDDTLPPHVQAALDTLGTDRIRREQYLDFVRNRTFRKSLFCHADCRRSPVPQVEALERLRFSALAKPESEQPDVHSEAPEVFCSASDDRLTTTKPLVKAALTTLFAAWPRSLPLDTLWDEVRSKLGPEKIDGDRAMLAGVLMKANRGNLVAIHLSDPPFISTVSERPIASIVARYQAEAEVKISTLRHTVIKLDPFSNLMIRLLDGTRDRAAILDAMARWAAEDVFEIAHEGQTVRDETQLRLALVDCLDESLEKLAKNALLVG